MLETLLNILITISLLLNESVLKFSFTTPPFIPPFMKKKYECNKYKFRNSTLFYTTKSPRSGQ